MLGTEWTAAGEGSTLTELTRAFDAARVTLRIARASWNLAQTRTNLRLTGSSITETDWERLESSDFKVGG